MTQERYQKLDRIAIGGMGEVWRARDTLLGRDVALKVLKAEFIDGPIKGVSDIFKHDLDPEPFGELGGQLTVRIGDDADRRVSGHRGHSSWRREPCAARNRSAMTTLLTAAAIGSAAVGRGSHPLPQPRRHHTTPPATQHADDTIVAPNARRRHQGMAAVAAPTARSIGK